MIPASVRDGMNAKTRKMIEVMTMPQSEVNNLLKRSPKQLQAYAILSKLQGKKTDAVDWGKKHKVSMSIIDGLIEKGLVYQTQDEVNREAYADKWSEEGTDAVDSIRELTSEQKKATDEICGDLDGGFFSARLLQGVTGSGKTEVYCQSMEKARAGRWGLISRT